MKLSELVDEYIEAKKEALANALKRSETLITKLGADYEIDEDFIEDAWHQWDEPPAGDAIDAFDVGIDVVFRAVEEEAR